MTYHVKDYKNYLETLKDFSKLDWVKNYLDLKRKPNFWTILEYGKYESSKDHSSHETKISKMIRWLMDANETHHLGNIFAQKFVELIGGEYTYSPNKNNQIKAITEYNHIDILYKDLSQNMCLAIEVKQYAEEALRKDGRSQLDDYRAIVETLAKEKGLQAYYIYLTVDKEDPTNQRWTPVSYRELIEIIDHITTHYLAKSAHPYVADTKKIIADFKDELQRSIDIKTKDKHYIHTNLSPQERDLTLVLADEITGEVDSKHLDQIMKVNDNEALEIKELILLTREHLRVQDHSPNDEIRMLIRKIYNYLSEDKQLDTNLETEYTVKDTVTSLNRTLIESHDLDFVTLELTRGKGQGLNIYCKDRKYRIYLSGSRHGTFPSDGIQLRREPMDEMRIDAECVKKGQFILKNNLILADKVSDLNGHVIELHQLIEDYVIPAIKELNDKVADV